MLINKKLNNDNTLQYFLMKKNIAFYGNKALTLPDFVSKKKDGKSVFFLKKGQCSSSEIKGVEVGYYNNLSEIYKNDIDVYFLDNNAVKVLLAKFPDYSHYIFINTKPRISWFIAIPGLIRRLLKRSVKIRSIVKLKKKGGYEQWLVIKNMKILSRQPQYTGSSISEKIGIPGLLNYLNRERIKYVVLRFYNKLPNLHREGGDLDILVEDESIDKVNTFLFENPGSIQVEIKPVSRLTGNGLPYYVPRLARNILESAIDGPAGSRIPDRKEAFLSFAYHVLYHKGLDAGVPSNLPEIKINEFPDNDYKKELANMAEELNIKIPIIMEDIERYLDQEGWRPKLDTLAKIALENEWVRKHLSFNEEEDLGIGVLILKEGVFNNSLTEGVLEEIEAQEGFRIVRKKVFDEKTKKYVSDHLRGGVWTDKSNLDNFRPAMAVVIVDIYCARAINVNVAENNFGRRIKNLKENLRKKFGFDKANTNMVHSTDNTKEAWEYIEVCFPDEFESIKDEIHNIHENIKLHWFKKILLQLKFNLHYFSHQIMRRIRDSKQTIHDFVVRLLID
jgi:hypothetical protein